MREIRRFTKVHTQTIAAPVVTTLLFLAVFVLALGPQVDVAGGISFAEFLAPGLVMMAMTQNAFANTSSSLVIAKVQGNIVDSLMPPLSPGELVVGFAAGGIVRGLVVGLVVAACLLPFVALHVHAWGWILFNGLMASQCGPAPPRGSRGPRSGRMLHGCAPARPRRVSTGKPY